MQILVWLLSSLSIIATVLPFSKSSQWWIRVFDYPRLQIAFFCLLSGVLAVNFIGIEQYSGLILVVILLSAFLYQLFLIKKYTPFFPVEAKKVTEKTSAFKIMQSNIKMSNKHAGKFLQVVFKNNPDILLVNEPDEWWAEQLIELDKTYNYSIKKPLNNTYGMMLFSKYPLKDIEINFLTEKGIPSFFACVTLPSGKIFKLHCLHPKPPMPGNPTYERDTEILLVGKRVKETGKPAIVMGDLNDVAWSYTSELFQRYSGLLDPRQGRGLFNTYNAFIPLFRYPLDHFFYSKHFGLIDIKRLEKFGSDHFPILLELNFNETKNHAIRPPNADKEDKQEAEEKIEEGR